MKYDCFQIGSTGDTKLVTYILDNIPDEKKLPIVLICPGGGFLDCSPHEGECVALRFCRAGYHAAVLYYSTRANNPERPAYPQAIYDLAEAVCLIRKNSELWRIHENKLAVLGFSAGGNVCALYGNCWRDGQFSKYGNLDVRKPNAVVLSYPLLDFRIFQKQYSMNSQNTVKNQDKESQLSEFWQMVNMEVFGNESPSLEKAGEASPLLNVNKDTPPTFLWHTFEDSLIPAVQTLKYAEELYRWDIPCELHVFEKGKHGLSLADCTSAKKENDISPHVAIWSDLVVQWLNNLFGQSEI